MNRQFDWKNIKKSDWIVLGLIGAILLVIMLPEGSSGGSNGGFGNTNNGTETMQLSDSYVLANSGMADGKAKENGEEYVAFLEEKLEAVLGEMEGVGKVKVMITLSEV